MADLPRVFICPGWPPKPYGEGCGAAFTVRHGQAIELLEDGMLPETIRANEESLAEVEDHEVLCPSCAIAMLDEASDG